MKTQIKQRQIETMKLDEAVEIHRLVKEDKYPSLTNFYDGLADTYRVITESSLLLPYDVEGRFWKGDVGYVNGVQRTYPEITSATPVIVKAIKEEGKDYLTLASCNKIGCGAGRRFHSGKFGAKYLERILENNTCRDIDMGDFDLENTIKFPYEVITPAKKSFEPLLDTINIFTDKDYEYPKIEDVEKIRVRPIVYGEGWTIAFPSIQENEKGLYDITLGFRKEDVKDIGFQWRGETSFEQALLKKFGGIKDAGNGVGNVNLDRFPKYLKRKLGVVSENEVYKENDELRDTKKYLREKVRELEEENKLLKLKKRDLTFIEKLARRWVK